MGRKKIIENIEKIENPINSNDSKIEEIDNDGIQAEKTIKKEEPKPQVNEVVVTEKPIKPKRQQTEKQKEVTAKMRQKLLEKRERDKEIKKILEEQKKQEIEDKVVKKAISIKKKQIKKQEVLDEISDYDDDNIPIKRAPAKKQQPKSYSQQPSQPRIIFV